MRFFSSKANFNNISAETHFTDLLASLMGMAWFVEARDPYTGGHLWRVSKYSRLLATAAGFSEPELSESGLRDHYFWGILLLLFLFHGPGKLSVDYFIRKRRMKNPATPEV